MFRPKSLLICLFLLTISPTFGTEKTFITERSQLEPYFGVKDIILVASPGRSGSTLLTETARKCGKQYKVLKTHMLPPDQRFKGKILFIFSNPDKAAESALHRITHSPSNGRTHFSNVESADEKWFNDIHRNGNLQTEEKNLLVYDALGCYLQLQEWLHNKVEPCDMQEAQILAIKYEHLWDAETVRAIQEFLQVQSFKLPPKRERGYDADELTAQEKSFKERYNLGTDEEPLYPAYDQARELWKQAPPFQFLELSHKGP